MKAIIVTEGATSQQQNIITQLLKAKGGGYWHHIANVWLITSSLSINPTEWRREIVSEVPDIIMYIFVFDEVDGWAARARKKSFEWITKNFVKSA